MCHCVFSYQFQSLNIFDALFLLSTAVIYESVNKTAFLKFLYTISSINISGLIEAFISNLRYCKWASYWLISAIWYWGLVADIEEIQMGSALDIGTRFILHTTNTLSTLLQEVKLESFERVSLTVTMPFQHFFLFL